MFCFFCLRPFSVPATFAASLMFVHWNGLQPLHRERGEVYYKYFVKRDA